MKNTILLLLLTPLVSCNTPKKTTSNDIIASDVNRKVASLDNNGDKVDDSFDPNLETYYKGSEQEEKKKIEDVANIIRQFIVEQQSVRQEVAKSSDSGTSQAKKIFGDLPEPTYATRDVHRKTNGCFKANLEINPDLMTAVNTQLDLYNKTDRPKILHKTIQDESELGVFAYGYNYDTIVRLSNGHPGNRPDQLPDARGFAIKILPMNTLSVDSLSRQSARDINAATKLDILSINFPTFFVNDPIKYAHVNSSFLDSAVDFKNSYLSKGEEFASIFITGSFTALERRLALWVNGSVIYTPLFQEYFSMVPSRLGPQGVEHAVKYSWEPVACSAAAQKTFAQEWQTGMAPWALDHTYSFPPRWSAPGAVKDLASNYLRQNVFKRLKQDDFCFNLYFQLYRDSQSTNIEDSTDIWLRTAAEKTWWSDQVVPDTARWLLDVDNTETRGEYLQRFSKKLLAPRILAGKLTIKKLGNLDLALGAENSKTCEDLSFNPWNGDIAHHKPLGIVSRMKRKVYNASRRERHELNHIDDSKIERY